MKEKSNISRSFVSKSFALCFWLGFVQVGLFMACAVVLVDASIEALLGGEIDRVAALSKTFAESFLWYGSTAGLFATWVGFLMQQLRASLWTRSPVVVLIVTVSSFIFLNFQLDLEVMVREHSACYSGSLLRACVLVAASFVSSIITLYVINKTESLICRHPVKVPAVAP